MDGAAMSRTLTDMKTPIKEGIDTQLLLTAWNASTEVQRDLVSVIERNEKEQKKTRADNEDTRSQVRNRSRLMIGMLLVTCSFALLASGWFARRMYSLELIAKDAQTALEETREETKANNAMLHDALELLRRQAKTHGLEVEKASGGDDTFDERAKQELLKASLQLQVSALEAEQRAARLTKKAPAPSVTKELNQVKARAKRLKVKIETGPLDHELK